MRIQRLWCWQAYNLNWWTGFLFVIGSVGFFTGAIAACYHYPGEGHRSYKIWSELVPYLGGGLCFVAGALTLTIQTYQLVDWDTKRDKPEFQKLLEGSFTGGDDAHRLMPGMVVLPEEPPPTRSFLGVWEVRCQLCHCCCHGCLHESCSLSVCVRVCVCACVCVRVCACSMIRLFYDNDGEHVSVVCV
jgi:hypothetical protein